MKKKKNPQSKLLGTSCPASCCIASLHPLVVPPSCPVSPITFALALAPSITCHRRAVHHRQAATDVAMRRCCNRPCPSRCASRCAIVCWLVVVLLSAVHLPLPSLSPRPSPATNALCTVTTLPQLPRRHQDAAAAALLRCRHCRYHCLQATAKLPSTLRCCAATTAAAAAAVPLFVGWLLHCCLPFNFVIACCHATIDTLVAGHFCQ